MNTKTNCCGGTATTCDSTIAELPRYYPRQLITPDDLTLEQNYFRDRMRRHNRLLHGWGVVCGALVCPMTMQNSDGTTVFTPWQVQVQRGYVLGPYGDEIILDCVRTVDLRTSGCSGVTGQPCIDAPDPWCSQVFTPPATTNTFFITIKYKQCMMRPVRVQPVGCGCDDTSCEYSRWHDGYEIGVLTTCPTCNACDPNVLPPPATNTLATGDIPACPDCSCGPWVCLAVVTLAADGTIQQIDNCSCRRLVLSFCNFWWQCTTVLSKLAVASPIVSIVQGNSATVTVTGNGLDLKAKYIFGPGSGVTVPSTAWTLSTTQGTSVDLTVQVDAAATPGNYTLTVVNPDCTTAIVSPALTVTATAAASKAVKAPSAPTNVAANAAAPATRAKPASKATNPASVKAVKT